MGKYITKTIKLDDPTATAYLRFETDVHREVEASFEFAYLVKVTDETGRQITQVLHPLHDNLEDSLMLSKDGKDLLFDEDEFRGKVDSISQDWLVDSLLKYDDFILSKIKKMLYPNDPSVGDGDLSGFTNFELICTVNSIHNSILNENVSYLQ